MSEPVSGPAPGSDLARLAFALAGIVSTGDTRPRMRLRRLHEAYADEVQGQVQSVGESVVVRFAPVQSGVDFALLEVPAVAGSYRIDAVEIDGTSVADLARRVIAVRERRLDEVAGDAVRVRADTRRPSVELDLRGLLPAGAVVALSVRREAWEPQLEAAIVGRLDAFAQDLRGQLQGLTELGFTLGNELRGAAARADARDGSLSDLVEAHTVALDALRTAVTTLNEQVVAHFGAQSGERRASLDALHADVRRAHDAVAEAGTGIAATHDDVQRLQAGIERLEAAVAEGALARAWRRLRGVGR